MTKNKELEMEIKYFKLKDLQANIKAYGEDIDVCAFDECQIERCMKFKKHLGKYLDDAKQEEER